MTIYQGMGRWTTKVNITFSVGNGVPSTTLKFFPQKTSYQMNESQKTSFGVHFPQYQWFYRTNSFQKNLKKITKIWFTNVCTYTNRVNFMKICSKLQPVS